MVSPTEMSNEELARTLDNYRHWTILELETRDLLKEAAKRLRGLASALPNGGKTLCGNDDTTRSDWVDPGVHRGSIPKLKESRDG